MPLAERAIQRFPNCIDPAACPSFGSSKGVSYWSTTSMNGSRARAPLAAQHGEPASRALGPGAYLREEAPACRDSPADCREGAEASLMRLRAFLHLLEHTPGALPFSLLMKYPPHLSQIITSAAPHRSRHSSTQRNVYRSGAYQNSSQASEPRLGAMRRFISLK
jgi:hypothetical protein